MKVFWRGLEPKIRTVLLIVTLLGILYVPAWAIINRIVGSNVVAGDGLILGTDGSDTLHVLDGHTIVIDNDSVEVNEGGNFVWTGGQDFTSATLSFPADAVDATAEIADDIITVAKFADGDWGDLTVATNVVTLDANVVATGEILDQTIVKADIDTTSTFVFGAAYHKTSATDDSMFMSKIYIDAVSGGDASKADIHDSLYANTPGYITKYDQFWGENDLSVDWSVSDSVDVFFPVSEKIDGALTHPYFLRVTPSSGAVGDQTIKIYFSGRLPMGFTEDCDSITLGYRTTTIDTLQSKVNLHVFAMKTLSGFAPADTSKYVGVSVSSDTTDLGATVGWDWLTITGASIGAIGEGSWMMYEVLVLVDQSDTVDVERPYFWGLGK